MSNDVPMDDSEYRHTGAHNAFRFDPDPLHTDLLILTNRAEELGYRLLIRDPGFTLTEVQHRLREDGPSAFLEVVQIQEDIFSSSSLPSAEEFVIQRLLRLKPESELIIADPYMFTSSRKNDADIYAASVAKIITPLLSDGTSLHFVADERNSCQAVHDEVTTALTSEVANLKIRTTYSRDFHDRFWIADRTRGVILGTSLNKIGSKIFFIDKLSSRDVTAVLQEVDLLLN